MLNRGTLSGLILVLILTLLMGCTSNGSVDKATGADKGGENPENPKEPVKLTVFRLGAGISDDEFQSFIAEPVHKKYTYITMEKVEPAKGSNIQDLVTSGEFPDMVFTSSLNSMSTVVNLNLPIDLNDLVKKYHYDIGKFEPSALAAIKNRGDKGQLYAIPFSLNFNALFYNKDIFDKFGVPYPKELMTWEETIELGKRVGRSDGGVQYVALHPGSVGGIGGQLSLPLYDEKSGKAVLATDGWKRALAVYKEAKSIPGNTFQGDYRNVFYKDQTLAMMVVPGARIGELEDLHKQGSQLNWDVTSVPILKERPGTGNKAEAHILMISATSKHQEDAFKAIMAVDEEENQLNMSEHGRLSSLKEQKMRDNYGIDLVSLKGKNVKGIFKAAFADPAPYSEYDQIIGKYLSQAADKAASSPVDINTALRQAEAAANKEIAGLKAEGK